MILELTVVFITLLIVLFFLILLVLVYGYNNYELIKNQSGWNKLIETKVTTAILEGSLTIKEDPELKAFIRNNTFKKIFLSVLIASEQKFSGDAHRVLIEIFYAFKLDTFAWAKFRSKDGLKKVRGLQTLTAMRVEKVLPEIAPLLTHNDPFVVSEAQYASVRLDGLRGLEFLTSLKSPLSKWQQLRLLRAINDFSPVHDNFLITLLKHQNISVVEFTLSLIRKFRILSCYMVSTELLTHENTKLRIEAVKTLQTIENEDTLVLMTSAYGDQEDEVKKVILLALKKSANKKSIDFLKTVIAEESEPLKIIAAETLFTLGQTEYLHALLEKESISEQIRSVVKHALVVKL